MKKLFLFLGLQIPTISLAKSYTSGWYKIAGGGTHQVSGTSGQPDDGGAIPGKGTVLAPVTLQ
jgi:hypothetical protein